MRKSILLAALILFAEFVAKSQEVHKDNTARLVSKGIFFVGFNSNMALGVAWPQGDVILPGNFKPKIGYFIRDRMSVGISYQGAGHSANTAPRIRLYHKGEIEMDYHWIAKKNFFLYSKTGFRLTQEQASSFPHRKNSTVDLKLGAGVAWRFKKFPRLGVNVEAAYYLDPSLRRPVQKFPEVTFGLSYFFKPKSTKK